MKTSKIIQEFLLTTEQKWCPFSKGLDHAGYTSVNRKDNGAPAEGTLCLGPGCACWIPDEEATAITEIICEESEVETIAEAASEEFDIMEVGESETAPGKWSIFMSTNISGGRCGMTHVAPIYE